MSGRSLINIIWNDEEMEQAGQEMYDQMIELYPICRSITGKGLQETFDILKKKIPIKVYDVPTGTKVFDWEVPREWNIRDAYIKNSNGKKIIDFADSNLHVVHYSIPIRARLSLDKLRPHLHYLPEYPERIPYLTSYYDEYWGFCLTYSQYKQLEEDIYEVVIDSTLEDGVMQFAELVLKGETEEEILLSCYVCHPSMCNDNLSGTVLLTSLAKILGDLTRRYTYRFLFLPETIGAITYLSQHKDYLKEKVVAGYIVTCVGDPGPFSYLKSRNENTLVDRVTMHVLKHIEPNYRIHDFTERGSDERQYCSPGIDLPVGSLMRTKHGLYSEYHTSADNLDLVTSEALKSSLEKYLLCINAFENNHIYKCTFLCEPQLSKRKMYPSLGLRDRSSVKNLMNLLAYCDGEKDIVWIADKINCAVWKLFPIVEQLISRGLIVKID